jgi:hypothetical protein
MSAVFGGDRAAATARMKGFQSQPQPFAGKRLHEWGAVELTMRHPWFLAVGRRCSGTSLSGAGLSPLKPHKAAYCRINFWALIRGKMRERRRTGGIGPPTGGPARLCSGLPGLARLCSPFGEEVFLRMPPGVLAFFDNLLWSVVSGQLSVAGEGRGLASRHCSSRKREGDSYREQLLPQRRQSVV